MRAGWHAMIPVNSAPNSSIKNRDADAQHADLRLANN
jgi:hypothetical protein